MLKLHFSTLFQLIPICIFSNKHFKMLICKIYLKLSTEKGNGFQNGFETARGRVNLFVIMSKSSFNKSAKKIKKINIFKY